MCFYIFFLLLMSSNFYLSFIRSPKYWCAGEGRDRKRKNLYMFCISKMGSVWKRCHRGCWTTFQNFKFNCSRICGNCGILICLILWACFTWIKVVKAQKSLKFQLSSFEASIKTIFKFKLNKLESFESWTDFIHISKSTQSTLINAI